MKIKKIITILSAIFMCSCNITTPNQDVEKLQKQFKIVYRVNTTHHVCIDYLNNVFFIEMSYSGNIKSKVKVNN